MQLSNRMVNQIQQSLESIFENNGYVNSNHKMCKMNKKMGMKLMERINKIESNFKLILREKLKINICTNKILYDYIFSPIIRGTVKSSK